ncbi:hypothetical protein GmRootA79_32230 [Acidovorax sp. A79]
MRADSASWLTRGKLGTTAQERSPHSRPIAAGKDALHQQKGLPKGTQFACHQCGSVQNTPHGSGTREVPPPWEGPQLRQFNYMALNSPEGIWPVRTASAAWARTAARSAVDL